MALKKCKECRGEVSTRAKMCPKCGAPVKKTTSLLTKFAATIVFGFLGLFILAAIGGGSSGGEASGSHSVSLFTGDSGQITRTGQPAMIAVDDEALNALEEIQAASDDVGFKKLLMAGKIFLVQVNTQVKILDTSWSYYKVRVVEGSEFGNSGWVVKHRVGRLLTEKQAPAQKTATPAGPRVIDLKE